MRKLGFNVATIAVLVVLWGAVTSAGLVSSQTLPGLRAIGSATLDLWAGHEILGNLAQSVFRILLSFLAGIVLGIPLGAVLWRVPAAGAALQPYLSAIYSVPLVVFYPFCLVLLGINDWPVVVLTAVMTTVPIALNTQLGLSAAPAVLVNVARGLERSPAQIFRQVRLPAAWPSVLSGLKLAMVYAVVGVVSMEFVAAQGGLGNRIQYYYETFDVASMYVFIVLTMLVSGCCILAVLAFEGATMHGRR